MSPTKKSSKLPAAPKHLTAESKKLWRKLNEDYEFEVGQLLILEGAMECFDRMREAQKEIEAHGILVDSGRLLRANPAAKAENDSKKLLLAHIRQLGIDLEPIGEPGRPPGA